MWHVCVWYVCCYVTGMSNFRNHPVFCNFYFAMGYSCESSRSGLIWGGGGGGGVSSIDW